MPYKDPEKQREATRMWKRNNKAWFWKFKKTQKCNRCGFSNPAALHFHHPGDKKAEICLMVNRGLHIDKIMEELKQCECLCANCHAIEHYEKYIDTQA